MHTARYRRQRRNFIFFLLPALFIYTLFWMLPILFNLGVSWSTWNGVSKFGDINWVGFRNYVNIFKDPIFYKAIAHNFQFTILSVIFVPALAFLVALVIEKGIVHKGFFRTTLFVPAVLPMLLVAILFRWIYSIDGGMINSLLGAVGLQSLQTDFLGSSKTALAALFAMGAWKALPFHMTIILSGLQGVPRDLEESALMDGCNKAQSVWYVTIPLMRPILVVVYGLVIIDGFRIFDLVFATTKGGPANATDVMATYIYRIAFNDFRLGYATALSTINVLVVLLISMVYFRISMRSNTE